MYSFPNICGILENAYATIDRSDTEIRFIVDLDVGISCGVLQSTNGHLYDMQVGLMSENLPLADFDLEVDDADGNYNTCLLEKLAAHRYITEIARRVMIKVLLNEAPEAAWNMWSLPMNVVNRIVLDNDDELRKTRELIRICWDWDCAVHHAVEIRRICHAVLSRSASLVAASIVAQAKACNGLQPALGGSIVAIHGKIYNENEFYRDMVSAYINALVGPALCRLLILRGVDTPTAVGGALRALRLDANKQTFLKNKGF